MCNNRNGNAYTLALSAGTYHLSGAGGGIQIQAAVSYDKGASVARYITDTGNGNTFTITSEAYVSVAAFVPKNTSVSNAVAKPQLEKGSTATSFVNGDATGQVWIETSDTSPAAFNAIKKNNVMVYPWSCYLYQQGAWKKKPAKSYIGGAWKSWAQYLFNLGDQCTDLTGGWMAQAVGRGQVAAPDYNQEAEKPVLTTQSNGGVKLHMDYGTGIYRTVNKIDLTGISTITFNGTLKARVGGDWTGIYVWSAIGTYYVNNVAAKYSLPAQTTLTGDTTLDVSGLTGSYYIGLGLHENTVNSDSGYIIMNSLTLS
jgi:hypothetical protein